MIPAGEDYVSENELEILGEQSDTVNVVGNTKSTSLYPEGRYRRSKIQDNSDTSFEETGKDSQGKDIQF